MIRHCPRYSIRACLILTAGLLSSCAHPRQTTQTRELSHSAPVALVPAGEFHGEAFGERVSPGALAWDGDSAIFTLDSHNARLLKFDLELRPLALAGGRGPHAGALSEPADLCVDNSLNVWVTDGQRRSVILYDAALAFVEEILFADPEDPIRLGRPGGVTVSGDGELWVTDLERSRIAVFDRFRALASVYGEQGSAAGTLREPVDIVTVDDRHMAVAQASGSIGILDRDGAIVNECGSETLKRPFTLAARGKYIWVGDRRLREILCFSTAGGLLFRTLGSGLDGIDPTGLVCVGDDKLAVSDVATQRITLFQIIYSTQ